MDSTIVDPALGTDELCSQMCTEAGLETDAEGDGPEDPAADDVAVALSFGCNEACGDVIDEYTVDQWGTDEFSEAICGYCGL